MLTEGGAIEGNCAIGKLRMPIKPATIKMIAMTQAKMGRSIKKRDMGVTVPCQQRRLRGPSGSSEPV